MELAFIRKKKRCDSKNVITVLSHTAVTSLLTHNHMFKCKHVTDDSKFSLFNSLVRVGRLNFNLFPYSFIQIQLLVHIIKKE